MLAVGVVLFVACSTESTSQALGGRPAAPSAQLRRAIASGREMAFASGDDAQQRAFQDNWVSTEEYVLSMERLLECLSEAGITPVGLGYDWTGSVYDYGVEGEAAGAAASCHRLTFEAIDFTYQMSLEDKRAALTEQMASCLAERGLDLSSVQRADGFPLHPFPLMMAANELDPELWDLCLRAEKPPLDFPEIPPPQSLVP